MMFDLFAVHMAGFLNHQQYVTCKLVLGGHRETCLTGKVFKIRTSPPTKKQEFSC